MATGKLGRRLRAAASTAALLLLFARSPSSAQREEAAADRDAADVVVLLDVSQSVLPYFQDVADYVVGSVVRDYLRYGDTFHLLSFGDAVRPEIVERMRDASDVKSALARLYLLYPLALYSDLLGALDYLSQYAADLPESRRKVLVVISDGIHNPPPSSPNAGFEPAALAAAIESTAERIRSRGWQAHFIALPFDRAADAAESGQRGAAAPGAMPGAAIAGTSAAAPDSAAAAADRPGSAADRPATAPGPGSAASGTADAGPLPADAAAAVGEPESYLGAAARALGTEVTPFTPETKEGIARSSLSLPRIEFPGPLGKRDYSLTFPIKVFNDSGSELALELEGAMVGDVGVLARKSFLKIRPGESGTMKVGVDLPLDLPEGPRRLDIELLFANGVRADPQSGVLDVILVRSPLSAAFRSGGRILLFIAILVAGSAGLLALLLAARKAAKRSRAPVVAAVLQSVSATPEAGSTPHPVSPIPAPPARATEPAAAGRGATAAASVPAAEDRPIERDMQAILEARRAEAARSAAMLAAASAGQGPARGAAASAASPPPAAAGESGQARAAEAAREFAGRRERRTVSKPGSILVELAVDDQNPNVGMRNIHLLRSGEAKTVGGGRSDFLVFLVKVPRLAAELFFDGDKLSFTPIKPDLFPDLDGPVEDCLGRPIPMRSRRGYPLVLRFHRYERPADRINRLLHCIEVPGLFSQDTDS